MGRLVDEEVTRDMWTAGHGGCGCRLPPHGSKGQAVGRNHQWRRHRRARRCSSASGNGKRARSTPAERTLEQAADGQTLTWKSPHSGNSGSITATRTYQADDGRYCRDYRQTITVGEENEELDGTACRRPEGFWGGSELTADAERRGASLKRLNFSGNRLKSG